MADVIVSGMEMPKDCPFCPMAHWNKFDALTGCNVVPGKKFVPETESEYWYSDHRPSWCPFLPLPEGHGDLIDRDAVKKHKWIAGVSSVVSVQAIDDAPTIVPAEGGGEDGKP